MWAEALMRPPNLLQNYLPSQEGVAYSQFIKMMIIFSITFITVLILKVRGPPTRPWGGWGACVAQALPCQTVRRQGSLPLSPAAAQLALGFFLQPSPTSSLDPTWDPWGHCIEGEGAAGKTTAFEYQRLTV